MGIGGWLFAVEVNLDLRSTHSSEFCQICRPAVELLMKWLKELEAERMVVDNITVFLWFPQS